MKIFYPDGVLQLFYSQEGATKHDITLLDILSELYHRTAFPPYSSTFVNTVRRDTCPRYMHSVFLCRIHFHIRLQSDGIARHSSKHVESFILLGLTYDLTSFRVGPYTCMSDIIP